MRLIAFLLTFSLLLVSNVFAEDVQVSITCPASVKVNSTNGVAAISLKGNLCPSITVSRLVRGAVGNTASATVGGLGINGPIYQSFTARTINCGATAASINAYIPVTGIAVNTVATFYTQILDSKGQVVGSGTCSVPIIP